METVCWLQIPHYVCRVSHVVSGLSAIWTGIYTRRDEFCLGALSRLCQQKVFMTLWKSDRHILQSTARQLVFLWYSTRRAGAWSGCPQAAGFLPSLSDIVILYTNSLFTIEHRWIHPFHALNLHIIHYILWRMKKQIEAWKSMNKSQRQKDQFEDQAPEGLQHLHISPRKVMEVSNIVPWVSGTRR